MADPVAPPPPPPTPDASIVSQLQSAGDAVHSAAEGRGDQMAARNSAMQATPPPPTDKEAAAPFGTYAPPDTASSPPPPPPSAAEAAAPEGSRLTPAKPAKPIQMPDTAAADKAAEVGPWDFVKSLVHGSGREAYAGAAEVGAGAARTTTMAAGAVAATADKLWDAATGTGRENGSYHTGAEDAVFDFDKNYIQPAIKHWEPAEDSGALARGIHQASSMIAAAPLGAAGAAQFATNAFTSSATDAVDKGKDANTAIATGTVDAVATWLMMKMLGKDALGQFKGQIPTAMIRKVATAIPTGDLINIGQDLTKQWLLGENGNDKQSASYKDKIVQHLTSLEELATNAIYGALGHSAEGVQEKPGSPAKGAPPSPPPSAAEAPEAPPPPPPPPAEAAKATAPAVRAATPAADALAAHEATRSAQPWSSYGHDKDGNDELASNGPLWNQRTSWLNKRDQLADAAQNEERLAFAKQLQTGAVPNETMAQTAERLKRNAAQTATPAPAAAEHSQVPDQPSAEPAQQIRAQLTDMRRADTPRRGVLISPDTQAHLDALPDDHEHGAPVKNQIAQARDQNRVVETPAGDLIVKTKADAVKARAQLKGGRDPQAVVGLYTGAGEGKDPSQTVVVQGREISNGAVTSETAVTPENEGAARQAMIDQGKIPVTTTPEGVITERAQSVQKERSHDALVNAIHEAVQGREGWQPEEAQEHQPVPTGDEAHVEETTHEALAKTEVGTKQKPPVQLEEARGTETSPEEIAAPAASKEVGKPKEGFIKTESGKELPVHIAGEAEGGKLIVHPLDENGEPGEARTVPAERVRTSREENPDVTKEPEVEAPKAGTALTQLPAALAAHERQESAVAGRKNAAPLKERQDNATSFAQVLKAAAAEAAEKGSASESTIGRATEAAKRAIRFADKSKEDTDKGRGTGHALITARVAEMHKAARELLGKTKEGEEQKTVEKKPVKPLKPVEPVTARESRRLEPPVPPVEKPQRAGVRDIERFKTLTDNYLRATKPEDAVEARDALAEHIRQVGAKLGHPPDQTEAAVDEHLRLLLEDRAEMGKRGTKMSDTIEDEEHEIDRKEFSSEEGFQSVYRPGGEGSKGKLDSWHAATRRTFEAMDQLGHDLKSAGVLRRLALLRDTGVPISYHELLGHVMKHAGAELQPLLMALRQHTPDVPTFIRSKVISPATLERVAGVGMFHASAYVRRGEKTARFDPSLQVRMGEGTTGYTLISAILHEGVHAATEYEIARNPTGELARSLDHALDILRKRLASKYGQEAIDTAINHWDPHTGRKGLNALDPALNHLYGITNTSEMIAELRSNPKFLEEVIRSEDFASPTENLPKTAGFPSLLHRIFSAIAKAMGYDNPKLMLHILDTSMGISRAQREDARNAPLYSEGAFQRMVNDQPVKRIAAMAAPAESLSQARAMAEAEEEKGELLSTPKPVKSEGAVRQLVSPETASAMREGLHEFKSRSVDMARNAVYALKTVGQIFRDGKSAFGHDDDTNPLNQLRAVMWDKNKLMSQMRAVTNPVAKQWQRLSNKDNLAVSQLMIDTTMWKIDPRLELPEDATPRQSEYYHRYQNLSPEAREVYDGATNANKTIRGMERRAAVDSAIEGFGLTVSDAQRQLLYGAKDVGAFGRMIKEGGLVDVGDKNDKLRNALQEWVGNDVQGPYHHLGRQGEYVVQAKPEGTKEFGASRAKAEAFAADVTSMSPNSKATAEQRGGQWVVDYKVDHVSMHATRREAEQAKLALEKNGFDTQPVTQKTYSREQAANLSSGMRELMSSVIQKITRNGQDKGTTAMVDNIHTAYLQMQAQRSAYAGSRLMRKNVAGVKAKDMRQNFAEHASSSMFHTAQIRTVFRQSEAMSRMRNMARDEDATQAQAYHRGEIVSALNDHAAQEAQQMKSGAFNAKVAQLGFMSYLASPAHAAIWLTQNFTTGIPWAGARYGYGKATAAFGKGMAAVTGPAVRQVWHEAISRGLSGDAVHEAVVKAIAAHPTMGKWADAIRELGARGVISHGYANELSEMARGSRPATGRVMDAARLLPAMADAINRTSTALAGLELTGGDLRKASDMVEAIHADYSAQNRPSAFKAIGKGPLRSMLMFKTYAQEMAHLTYSNLYAATKIMSKDPDTKAAAWTGAKTVAGLMVANSMFAGVYGAAGLEPARLLIYAYHKLFDEEGEVWDMKNAVHHFLVDHFGAAAGNSLARGPIASALGVDVQDRMGLANLFFHDPPDLLTTDKDVWKSFVMDEGGPMLQWIVNGITGATGHVQNGEYAQALGSIVPIKLVQDGLKGLELLNSGKTTGTGAHITQPSAADALKQTFGLKPAAVADAQEKQGVKAEISREQQLTKGQIIKQLLSHPEGSPERDAARARLRAFNERNPGAGITRRGISSEARHNYEAGQDLPSRNQRVEKAEDFSGN